MIQPIDTTRNNWRLLWLDLEEPVPKSLDGNLTESLPEFYLPTCLLVTTAAGKPICSPEILEELYQPLAEQLLGRLFDEHGVPDRLTIAESNDWDTASWRNFALDCRIEIAFESFPSIKPGEMKQVAHRIAQRFQGGVFHSPSTVALGLVASARRLRSPEKRAAYLRKAVEHDANCASARIELADTYYQAARWNECRQGYQGLVEREERRWQGEHPEWWTDPETRPYLRALYGRAMTEWQQGRFDKATIDLEKLLALNPADNQGSRFLIPLVHLLGNDDEKALQFFEAYDRNYPDDYCEPALLFGRGLAQWRAGDEVSARASYHTGIVKNLYIAPFLLDLPLPPADLWHPNDRSELGYGQDFIQSYAMLWDRDPSALRFLREVYSELLPNLEKVVSLRRKMSDWQDQRYDRNFKDRWKEMTALDELLTGGPER